MANRRKWLTDFDAGLLAISRITKLAKFCTQQVVKQYFRQKNTIFNNSTSDNNNDRLQ